MFAFGVGLPGIVIAYPVLYLFLSRSFNFRLSKKVIIISIIMSSFLSGFAQLKLAPDIIQTASGAKVVPSNFSTLLAPFVISMVAILIPFFFVKKTVNTISKKQA